MASEALHQVHMPRIAIKFCVQCKWNLRAAYYAQELLQTFSTSLGEVSLIPVTGGIFTVTISYSKESETSAVVDQVLWDRKTEGGFPETKELKNRVRNIVKPDRDLGHIDRSLKKGKQQEQLSGPGKSMIATAGVEENEMGKGNSEMTKGPVELPETGDENCKDCP